MNTTVRIGVTVSLMVAVLGMPDRAYVAPDRQDVAPPKPLGTD